MDLALSVGIFPYVLKLLQTISIDLRPTLVFIWCKILALDLSCQVGMACLQSKAGRMGGGVAARVARSGAAVEPPMPPVPCAWPVHACRLTW